MSAELPPIQDFSQWNGAPFFKGAPEEGRRVYVVKTSEEGDFLAYGVIEPGQQYVFRVRGVGESELERFLAQMTVERAAVTHGPPPFETNTGGDKPPTKGPAGTKGPPPKGPR
jgi:hypothetical protein